MEQMIYELIIESDQLKKKHAKCLLIIKLVKLLTL